MRLFQYMVNNGNLQRFISQFTISGGTQLFSSDSPYFQWDGTYNGEPVPQDVYTYRITYTQNKKPYYDNILGQLTLLR
jgi:gliding motility-associated-like protein